ncbi:hypothetical protein [Scytonema sp. PRP1]|uniref:hypothetical protein n=1 Tax=Scytonema sp. PRP1 TaxID=3120513 RepID=UPI002FD37AEA
MSKNYSPTNRHPRLNLDLYQAQLAEELTTTETKGLIVTVARQDFSVTTVRDRLLKEGGFVVPYLYGELIISPSKKVKRGNHYLLDVKFSPTSFINM